MEYIDFRGGTGNDNIYTFAATSSVLYGGTENDTLTTGTGLVIGKKNLLDSPVEKKQG